MVVAEIQDRLLVEQPGIGVGEIGYVFAEDEADVLAGSAIDGVVPVDLELQIRAQHVIDDVNAAHVLSRGDRPADIGGPFPVAVRRWRRPGQVERKV